MKKYLISAGVAALAFISVASAQSYSFNTDLYLGSQGGDVANLQTFLIADGYSIPAISSGAQPKGYFGTQTQAALAAFQRSVGITANGYFGPQTRAFIDAHGLNNVNPGGPMIPAQPIQPTYPTYPTNPTYPTQPSYPNYPPNNYGSPVISGIDAPTSLNVNQTGTWTIHASEPQNGVLSYSVDWGDSNICQAGYACSMNAGASASVFFQQTSFTHSYASPGTYTVRFTARDAGGLTAQTSATVQVGGGQVQTGASPLQIISPNGNEVWQRGTTHTITWSSPYYFAAAYANLQITQKYNCTTQICPALAYAPLTIATNIPINQNSYSWNVGSATNFNGQVATLPDGQYTVQICQTGGTNCDSSDNTFTITSGTIYGNGSSQITVTSPNGGEQWQANTVHQITWSAYNSGYSNAVDIYLGQNVYVPCAATPYGTSSCNPAFQPTYTLDRNIASSAAYNWVVGTDINNNVIPAGTYSVEVCPSGSTVNCDISNGLFTIVGTAYPVNSTSGYNNSTGYYTGTNTYNNGYYQQPGSSVYGCPAGYVCTPVTSSTQNPVPNVSYSY